MTRAKPDKDQSWCPGWALAEGQCEHWGVRAFRRVAQAGWTLSIILAAWLPMLISWGLRKGPSPLGGPWKTMRREGLEPGYGHLDVTPAQRLQA